MEIQQKIDHYFLLFFLISQQLITIASAIYYFNGGQTLQVVFFIAISSVILLALASYCVFLSFATAKWLLLFALIIGSAFLIVTSTDAVSSIWCITAVPAIGLLLGHLRAVIVLVTLYTSAFLYLLADLSPLVSLEYDGILLLRFLFSYCLLIMHSMAMEQYRFSDLRHKNIGALQSNNNTPQDILTELPHRHCMEEFLKSSYKRLHLGGQYLSVILADLDNCKAINDLYGRAIGDLVLKKLGHLLKSELREEDMAGRWNGDQFILVLPNISQTTALTIAERIRLRASQMNLYAKGDQVKCSLSIGICSTENSTSIDDLLSVAENCVYQAKQMGRNMVIAA